MHALKCQVQKIELDVLVAAHQGKVKVYFKKPTSLVQRTYSYSTLDFHPRFKNMLIDNL